MAHDAQLEQAFQSAHGGDFAEAAAVCRRLLKRDAKNVDALALLGMMASQQGDDDAAAEHLAQAIRIAPRRWDLYFNAGLVLRRLGRVEDAVLRLRKAATLNEANADIHYHLGRALAERSETDAAIESLRRAADLAADHAQARAALADLLHGQGRLAEAAVAYEAALAIDDAATPPTRALGQCRANVCYGLGHLRSTEQDHAAAAACFEESVTLDDTSALSWFGLGCAELARKHYAAATTALARAVRIDPLYAEAYQNLGQARFNLGEVDAALDCFAETLRIATSGATNDSGTPSATHDALRLAELARRSIAVVIPGSAKANHRAVREARAAWGAMQRATPVTLCGSQEKLDGRLRIGYVSAFFGSDNWMKPVWGLINQHDRTQVQVFLFSDGKPPPGIAALRNNDDSASVEANSQYSYRPAADDQFHDLTGQDNDAAAARIAACGIDVLVDLNGYSRMDRLAVYARRPAPVIAAWFNQFATTGMPWFDYLIGDSHVIRPEEEAEYTERIVRVSGSYLTFSVDYPVPEVSPPPCAVRGYVTFGSLCSQYKLTDDVFSAWAEILRNVPQSRLVLKNATLGVEAHRRYLLDKLQTMGVEPSCVTLAGPEGHYEFLKTYADVDIALDAFPYNGGTTTTEAIWQGVPVVAYDGDRWAGRTSKTLLCEAGLGDWVAADRAGYIRLASDWGAAADTPNRLAALRSTMRERLKASSVCNTAGLARSMEAAYRAMVREMRNAK